MQKLFILLLLTISFYSYSQQCPEKFRVITNSSQGEIVQIYLPELDSTVSCRLTANSQNINCPTPIRNLIRNRKVIVNGCFYECTDTCNISNETPVELIYFEVLSKSNNLTLKWSTASEKNNSHFTVQRSFDLSSDNWEDITSVEGNGTTSLRQNYKFSYTENNQKIYPSQIVYFRLKQVDYDGKYEYSPIIQIELYSGSATIEDIFDINGNKVSNFNQAPKGIYFRGTEKMFKF